MLCHLLFEGSFLLLNFFRSPSLLVRCRTVFLWQLKRRSAHLQSQSYFVVKPVNDTRGYHSQLSAAVPQEELHNVGMLTTADRISQVFFLYMSTTIFITVFLRDTLQVNTDGRNTPSRTFLLVYFKCLWPTHINLGYLATVFPLECQYTHCGWHGFFPSVPFLCENKFLCENIFCGTW